MDFKNKILLSRFKDGPQARGVQAKALKVRVQLDPPDVGGLEAVQLFLPLGVAGVQGAEGNDPVGMRTLQGYGLIVGRVDLGRGRGRAEHHAFVNSAGAMSGQQVD